MARDCLNEPAVDESFENRRNWARSRAVESAVRAAGGFPTQGGGTTSLSSRAPALARHEGRF